VFAVAFALSCPAGDATRDDPHRHLARVIERVRKDAIIIGMLKHNLDGIEGASELAALLHCAVKDIYRARERLAHHRDQVLEEERREEETRMKKQGLSP
jgi:hypothetical protein